MCYSHKRIYNAFKPYNIQNLIKAFHLANCSYNSNAQANYDTFTLIGAFHKMSTQQTIFCILYGLYKNECNP